MEAAKTGLMETVKTDHGGEMGTGPQEAGSFYRRIGGTLFKVKVHTGSGYADTLDKKISRLIFNEMVTGGKSCVKMDSPQMSRPPERSSA